MKDGSLALRFGPVSQTGVGPLYGQLLANVKREVIAGRLESDAALPSTRALAAGLMISVITVTRAYEELERAGIVYSRQGQGTFVTQAAKEILKAEQSAPWKALVDAVNAAQKIRMSDDDLVKLLHTAMARRGKE